MKVNIFRGYLQTPLDNLVSAMRRSTRIVRSLRGCWRQWILGLRRRTSWEDCVWAPDFGVRTREAKRATVGHIEAKDIGADLRNIKWNIDLRSQPGSQQPAATEAVLGIAAQPDPDELHGVPPLRGRRTGADSSARDERVEGRKTCTNLERRTTFQSRPEPNEVWAGRQRL